VADEADTETRQMPVIGIPPRNAAQWRGDILIAVSLSVLAFALFIVPTILYRPLYETPETRIAVVAREMLQSGDLLVPTVGGKVRLTKPPLPYWLTALTAKIIGGDDHSERVMTRAVQIPSALFAAFAVFLLVLYGGTIGGRSAGVMAGIILGFSVLISHYAQLGYGDTILMATTAATFCCAAWILCVPHAGVFAAFGFGVSLGMAVLTKGHIPVVFCGLPLLVEIGIRRSFNARKVMLFAMGLVVAVCVAGPWFYLIENKIPGALAKMISKAEDIVNRGSHDHSFWFYFYTLAGGLLPWTPVLLCAWPIYLFKKRTPETKKESDPHQVLNEHLRFFALAAVLGFIALMCVRGKQEYYLLPLIPAIALSSGLMLSRLKFPGGFSEERLAWTQLVAGVAIGLFVCSVPLLSPMLAERHDRVSVLMLKANELLGWPLIPIGVALILVYIYSARQWVEARSINAMLVPGVIGYAALMVWSFHWTEKQQKYPLAAEAGALRERANTLVKNVPLYAAVQHESWPTLTFYLERPVGSLADLRKELADPNRKPGPHALIADQDRLRALNVPQLVPNGADGLFIIPTIDDAAWSQITANETDLPE
jgi:4-amino-4-deoxy-L-arabinose transferase-like glycosyltransferase